MSRPRLSVLIVSWNVADLIENCINSVVDSVGDFSREIIVIDNASTDGTCELVAQRFPDVRWLRNESNVGFPHANNQALALARGEYVLYLNPDTVVEPNTLAECIRELDRDRTIGVVGCRLDLPTGEIQPECARRAYRLRHMLAESLYLHMFFPRSRLFGDLNLGWWDHRGSRDVEAIVGAFMMARREVAEQVGGLPEDLFMYHEDVSFCIRVRQAGWRIRYRGDIGTLHLSGQSSARSDLRLELLHAECRLLLLKETQGRGAALLGRALWAATCLARSAIACTAPLFPAAARRYPRVFNLRTHLMQFAWCAAPWRVSHLLPRAEIGKTPTPVAGSADLAVP